MNQHTSAPVPPATATPAAPGDAVPELTPELQACLDRAKSARTVRTPHLSLTDLQAAVEARQSWGEYWEMPPHLAECGDCLEAFQILLDGAPAADPASLARFERLHSDTRAQRRFRLLPSPAMSRLLTRIAACVAAAVTVIWLLVVFTAPPSVKVQTGTLVLNDSGRELRTDAAIPASASVRAVDNVEALFADGSRVVVRPESRFSLNVKRFSGETVTLFEGEVSCAVAKQKSGRTFRVLTPAGEVTVVGTEFSVTSRTTADSATPPQGNTPTAPHRNGLTLLHPMKMGVRDEALKDAGLNTTVEVRVKEACVRVRNRSGHQVSVTPGQTAVMRGTLPVVDVFEPER